MKDSTLKEPTYYGLDVHQATISVARCSSRAKKAEYLETIKNDPEAIKTFFKKELKKHPWIQSAYEAGACGFHVHDTLCSLGIDSQVIAPSKVPTTRVRGRKNDKRDSMHLAKCLRNGDLTFIHIPDEEQMDMREFTRYRESLSAQLRDAKNKVMAMLRRKGFRFTLGKKLWTKTYKRWLNTQKMPSPCQQLVFEGYREDVDRIAEKMGEVDQHIEMLQQRWTKHHVVRGLMALRGIGAYTAASLVGEIGQFSRFETAGHFMSYLGLTPNEFSSGERVPGGGVDRSKIKQGCINKAGNKRLRWLLVEAAWHAHHRPRTDALKERWKGLPKEVIEHAWKAQKRLYKKRHDMTLAHKSSQKTNIAVARELAGFIWAIGCMMEKQKPQQKKAA